MSYISPIVLRLRLEEAEARTSRAVEGRELIALKWGVVQQPEFGPIWDTLVTSMPENEYAQQRINELLDAMRIPLEPGRLWDSLDLVDRLLAHRRYVLAVIETKEWNNNVRWQIRRYFRKTTSKGDG